jgi:WD40 repeat protein
MPLIRLAWVLGIFTVVGQNLYAQEGALKDINGDPLPPGAFARLGAMRFRVAGPVFGARFPEGGKKLLVRVQNAPAQSGFPDKQGTFVLFAMENGLELNRIASKSNDILRHFRSTGPISDWIGFSNWCLSPDAKMIANLDDWRSSRLQVRELATGKVIFEVQDDELEFHYVQFSPDSKQVAAVVSQNEESAKKDKKRIVVMRLWDLQSRKEVRTFVPPPQPKETFQPHWFTFSPDGAYLAATGYEQGKAGIVRVWDVAGKSPSWKIEGETETRDQARSIAFSPDSKTLAAVYDGKIRLWDPATGKRGRDVADYEGRCASLDFSPDGKRLIAGAGIKAANPNVLRMWDLSNSREVPLPPLGALGYVFSESSETLVLADPSEHSLVICDAGTGQIQQRVHIEIPRNRSENLEHLFYKARQGMGWPFALSTDGKTLVACDQPGQLRRFEVATGKEIPPPGLVTDPACALAFSPDGKKLLAAGRGRVLLHDVNGKTPPVHLLAKNAEDRPNPNSLAISSDGKRAAAGWDNGLVTVWETGAGKLLWQSDEHERGVWSLGFAQDNQTLISTGLHDGQVIWWIVATGQKQRRLALNSDKDPLSPSLVVLGSNALTAFLYSWPHELQESELASGKFRRKFNKGDWPVAFSPDGQHMLISSQSAFHLIDLVAGDERRSFAYADHENPASSLQACARFSPDGRIITGIAGNDVVRVWDRDTATLLATLSGHDGGPSAVAFAPDGQSLASSAGDGTILLWRTLASIVPTAKEQTPPPPKMPTPGKDSEGAPLPAAAKTRLGLLRFQHGVDVCALRYTPAGKSMLVLTNTSANGWVQGGLALWDAKTGKLQRQMDLTKEHSRFTERRGGWPFNEDWCVSHDATLLAESNTFVGSGNYLPLSVKEIGTGEIIYQAKGIESQIAFAQFTPNSKSLWDLDTFTLVDLATGHKQQLERTDNNKSVLHAEFSLDGKILVVVNGDETIDWWHLDRGGRNVRLPQRILGFYGLAIAPDSKHLAMLAAGEKDNNARMVLVQIESGKTVRDFGEQDQRLIRFLFSPDGKQLVTISDAAPRREVKDGKDIWIPCQVLRRWEIATGKELPPIETTGGLVAQFTPDGQALAIASGRYLRLHNAATGRELRRFPLESELAGVLSQIKNLHYGMGDAFAFSPDGKTVAVAAGRTVRQFDVETGKEIGPTPISQTLFGLAVAKDAQWIASCSLDEVMVWDSRGNKVVLSVQPWSGANKEEVFFTATALSSDGSRLVVGGSDGDIALFDLPSGKRLRQLHFHTAPVTSLVLLAGNTTLVSADNNGHIAYWDLAAGALLRKLALPGATNGIKERLLIEGGTDGRKEWLSVKTPKDSWEHFLGDLPSLAPDGHMLLAPQEQAIHLLELDGPKASLIKSPHRYNGKVAISHDHQMLAVLDGWQAVESIARLIDVASGRELRAVASTFAITDFCFSPDGTLLAASGEKGLAIWDTATGTIQAEFNGHRGIVTTVAFSPDGGTLVSAAHDGTLLLWDVATLIAKPQKKDLSAGQLKALWDDLASPDAVKAGTALRQLVGDPRQTAALFGEKLKAVTASEKEIVKLVADLDSAQPKIRATATKELQQLGEIAEPALRACLAATPMPEQRARVLQLLARLGEPVADGDKLRALRAVEVLELVGTPEAAQVLRTLAGGVESSYVTRQAAGALRRMHLQPVTHPPKSNLR